MAEQATTGSRIVAGAPRYAFLSVTLDEVAMRQLQDRLAEVPNALARVMPPALNKTAQEARTLLYREFLTRMNIARKASIKDRLEHAPKASRSSWAAGVRIALTRFTVASFKGTRQMKAGVRWSPEQGVTQMIPRAFIRQGLTHYKTGEHMELRQVWRRLQASDPDFRTSGTTGGGHEIKGTRAGDRVQRYPLKIMRGPSLAKVFSDDPGFQAGVEAKSGGILTKKIEQQIDRIAAQVTR